MRIKVGSRYQIVAEIDQETGQKQIMLVHGLFPAFKQKFVRVPNSLVPVVTVLKKVKYKLYEQTHTAYLVNFQGQECYCLEWQFFKPVKGYIHLHQKRQ
jgi:hypothetical protein